MKHTNLFKLIFFFVCVITSGHAWAQRSEQLLEKGWRFTKGDVKGAETPGFDDSEWEAVTIPHDWAIFGPFDRSHDLQNVAVTQNFETEASVKPDGRADCHTWV